MRVLLAGPRITPPWDSAASTAGRLLLNALRAVGAEVSVATTRIPLRIVAGNYSRLPPGVTDFKGLEGGSWIVGVHRKRPAADAASMLAAARRAGRGFDAAISVGAYTWSPLLPSQRIIVYTYTSPGGRLLRLLALTARAAGKELVVATPSVLVYREARRAGVSARMVPPVVDTESFHPTRGARGGDGGVVRLGYAGPVHPGRLPVARLAAVVSRLTRMGLRVEFAARTLLRHGRRDYAYLEMLEKSLRRAGAWRLDVSAGQLTRGMLNEFYNGLDALLYFFKTSREAELADPPLVPLEALSAGTPVLVSRGSSLDYYLSGAPGVLIGPEASDSLPEVIEVSRPAMLHTFIRRRFTYTILCRALESILEEHSWA